MDIRTRRQVAAFLCIPGAICVFFFGLYFAMTFAMRHKNGPIMMLGCMGVAILLVAACLALWPSRTSTPEANHDQ